MRIRVRAGPGPTAATFAPAACDECGPQGEATAWFTEMEIR
jgi:hypothetical protein